MKIAKKFQKLFHSDCDAKTCWNTQANSNSQTKREIHSWQSFLKLVAKEEGNVESALVLIPMLVLFLIGVQVIVATNIRNADLALAQGDAAARAISHEYQSGDEFLEVGGRIEKIQLLVTHRSHTLPQIVPGLVELMGGAPATDVVGIAVVEPSND